MNFPLCNKIEWSISCSCHPSFLLLFLFAHFTVIVLLVSVHQGLIAFHRLNFLVETNVSNPPDFSLQQDVEFDIKCPTSGE